VICLHDTLTGRVRPLRLRRKGEVSMYVCGPTVYDVPHLGHARSALTYDVLRRYLQWRGLAVRHVANITDIDDKIIERARREGRSEPEVAAEFEAVYTEAMDALGVLAPHERPRATEWVNEMVALTEVIAAAGGAYTTEAGVYLRVREVPGYTDLVHRGLEDLRASAGSRVDVDEAKEDPLDFALWKAAKPGEPAWASPWGPGRPGWHIECAAMSLGLLGDGFDLHGGGDDLVFPHHTNERAEALAAGRSFAGHWLHNAMLNVSGDKMSKSTGNFLTISELLEAHPDNGRALRLLVLRSHYRKTMEVAPSALGSARAAVSRLDALHRRATAAGADLSGFARIAPYGEEPVGASGPTRPGLSPTSPRSPYAEEPVGASGRGRVGRAGAAEVRSFQEAMDDDLGTPAATAVVFDTVRRANAALDACADEAGPLAATAIGLAGVLGVEAGAAQSSEDSVIAQLVERRQKAREARDWAVADAIRDQLTALGAIVEDTPAGTIWHRRAAGRATEDATIR